MTATLDLMNALRIVSGTPLSLSFGQETSGQAGGQVRVRDLRAPLWQASIQTAELTFDQLAEVQAEIEALGGSRGTFLMFNSSKGFPKADPDGSILGAASVTIHSMADANHVRLEGLPAGYVLSKGDLFGFVYGGTHYALHRFAETVTASGGGISPSAKVTPPIRAGASVGAAVTLVDPTVEMIIVPGSYSPEESLATGSVSFSALQVI